MHYEIWDIDAGNRIMSVPSEAEALATVRAFLNDGWNAADLAVGAIPDAGELADDLPPAITGHALAERAFRIPA